MKRLFALILLFTFVFSITVIADEDEVSSSADINYGYDESYDETGDQDITSAEYDNEEQGYNKYFDERVINGEETSSSKPKGIKVFLNGKQLEFDVEPMIINSRTMVPLRVIFEALGAKVDWDGRTQTAIGETKNTIVKISIGKEYLLKNDNIVVLDSPAVVISGRTLVPARAIAESLDCKVEWYGETQVVEILK